MSLNRRNNQPWYKRPTATRSKIMRSVKTKNTGAELIVRRILHSMGYRYRLHVKGLPGTPDIVFKKRKKVIFVNGCFWHGHSCAKGRMPKANAEFWKDKIGKNVKRDRKKEADLASNEWGVLVIWQCELADLDRLRASLGLFLRDKL
jgi:DNA mismatch endonuclease, patch repair protein